MLRIKSNCFALVNIVNVNPKDQNRRTQDFTMEGVDVARGRARGSGGRKSPSGVRGQSPGRGSGAQSPPEAEAKCEISVQFLTFFLCIKFGI